MSTPERSAVNSEFSMIPYPGKDNLFRILAEARRRNNANFVTFTGVTRKEFYRVVQKRKTNCGGRVRVSLSHRGNRRFNYHYDYDDETEILTVQVPYSDPSGSSKNMVYRLMLNIHSEIRNHARRDPDKFRWIHGPWMFRGIVGDKRENDSPGRSSETMAVTARTKSKGNGDEETDTDAVLSIWKTASACGGPYLQQPKSTPAGGTETEPDDWPSIVIIHAPHQYLSWLRRDVRRWFVASGHEVKIVLLIQWSGPDPQQDTIIERWEEEQEGVVGMEIDGLAREEGTEKQASTSKRKEEVIFRPKLQQTINLSLELEVENGTLSRRYQASDDLVLKFPLLLRREPQTRKEKDVVISACDLEGFAMDCLYSSLRS